MNERLDKAIVATGQRDDAGARMPDWLTRPDTDPYMAAGKPSLNDEELEMAIAARSGNRRP